MDERSRRDSARVFSLLDLWRTQLEQVLGAPLDPAAAAAFSGIVGAAIDHGRALERDATVRAVAECEHYRARNAASQRVARAKTAEVARLRHRFELGDTQPIALAED